MLKCRMVAPHDPRSFSPLPPPAISQHPPNDRSYVHQNGPQRNPPPYQPTRRRVLKTEEMVSCTQRHRHQSIIGRHHMVLTLATPFQSDRAPVTAVAVGDN